MFKLMKRPDMQVDRRLTSILFFFCFFSTVFVNQKLSAQSFNPSLSLTRVATGLSSPVFATSAPGDSDHLYIVERGGHIRLLNLSSGNILPTNFLTTSQLNLDHGFTSGNERGLLGLAFHPDYATNGRYFVNYTDGLGNTRVRSYQRSSSDPLTTDGASRAEILQINQPFPNHNAGWMDFGQDGQLYIATGDGGSSNDPGNVSQNRNSLLGKMLRITPDVTSTGGYSVPTDNPFVGQSNVREEIWAYGLRNPWRNSFDRLTGDLYIADVGQNDREEINFQYADSNGGENYGWRMREGTIQTPGSVGGPRPSDNVDPIYDYLHGFDPFQGRSVTGGYVYRGPIEGLQGHYFFGDFVSQRLFSLRFDGSPTSQFDGTNFNSLIDWTDIVETDFGSLGGISSFGEDSLGNLYLVNLNGSIYRFSAGAIPEPNAVLVLGLVAMFGLMGRRRVSAAFDA